MQTKKQSLLESLTNVAIGYGISLVSLFIIFPIVGIQSSISKNHPNPTAEEKIRFNQTTILIVV